MTEEGSGKTMPPKAAEEAAAVAAPPKVVEAEEEKKEEAPKAKPPTASPGKKSSSTKPNDPEAEKKRLADLEARAVAEATASADESYVPSPSLLNADTAEALLKQVDGADLTEFERKDSVYSGRSVPIALRAKLEVPIHVTAPGSVVEYAVDSQNYDIGFGITAEREEGVTIVKEPARVESHISTVTGKFLVGAVPCMLVFSFDNEYSWFREKLLTYRITVSPPSQDVIMAGRRRRARACHKTVTDDLKSAQNRLDKAQSQKSSLQREIDRLQKAMDELKKSLDVAETEEKWLVTRVELRKEQERLLSTRLSDGWDDEEKNKKSKAPAATTNGEAKA
mmetsp:Transcript_5008/g.7059  ORF Transcript_5008/g.7059 Transcript_5008/m.7059 type:complete len:337 (-) Transcript_5008:173-1183(-)